MLLGNTVGSLTLVQHAILVGSLLGDGALRLQRGKLNALLEVNHAFRYKEYVNWKFGNFRDFVLTPSKSRLGNGSRVAYRFTTRSLPVFTEYYWWFYRTGRKRIPLDLILDALSLAVWFMDDGGKSRTASYLNTQQFPTDDQELLLQLLRVQFGIDGTLNKDKEYYRIRVSKTGTEILKSLVDSFVLPCFRYKLS